MKTLDLNKWGRIYNLFENNIFGHFSLDGLVLVLCDSRIFSSESTVERSFEVNQLRQFYEMNL